MAYGKKRTRHGRVLGRRKSFRKRGFVRRASVRRLKRRGGVYTKRTKFPVKNPFGDRALVKLRANYYGTQTGDSASTQMSTPFTLNDLSDVYTAATYTKGFLTYPKLFKRYKVNGVLCKFTSFQIKPSSGSALPMMSFLIPYSILDGVPTVVAQNPGTIKGERHTKWGYVKNWGEGGGPTTIKKFFKMKTLVGANYPSTDIDYSGTTITPVITNAYASPAIEWAMLFGHASVSGAPISTGDSVAWQLEMTYYVEFFEQTWEAQGL